MLQFACSQLSTPADFFGYGAACDVQADDATDVETVNAAIDMASDMLTILSMGHVTGICTRTVYPFGGDGCWPTAGALDYYDAFGGSAGIPLRGPNPSVTEVNIFGEVLSPSAYRIVDHEFLIRIDGGAWPSWNTFGANGWTVTFSFGREPDKITRDATNELAAELIQDSIHRSSNLPPGITSINLQGVSASLKDTAEALREGHENMPAVARFLGIYNEKDARAVNGVWSPELSGGWKLHTLS